MAAEEEEEEDQDCKIVPKYHCFVLCGINALWNTYPVGYQNQFQIRLFKRKTCTEASRTNRLLIT